MTARQLSVAALLLAGFLWLSNASGTLPENTGAPDELTCGRAPCHNIPPNTGTGQAGIDVNGGLPTYRAGDTLLVTVSISEAQSPRNGFQIVALDEENHNIGTWLLTAPDEMQLVNGLFLPRKYVTHQAAGNMQDSWTMAWIAPGVDAGEVTFYAAILDGNDDGLHTGDALYLVANTISFDMSSATRQPAGGLEMWVFPNPAIKELFVSSPNEPIHTIRLMDVRGKLLRQWPANKGVNRLDLSGLAGGTYFLAAEADGRQGVRKVVIW